ncbi:Na+/H+ antiporter NhaA [Dongia sp.]|uniref:Na+/H+ antiporter NhaA n=1 Tax=Dongia sp. TaxID=1977262 RepID=UPI0035AED08F
MSPIRRFLQLESAGGIILLMAAVLAFVCENSALSGLYQGFLSLPFGVSLGEAGLEKPILLWINDGLMAVFFLVVGSEIKRELVAGELSSPAQAALPGIAALGGMAVPAMIYVAINWSAPELLVGWAIPSATDIAFAVAVLTLLGPRMPHSLKIFLLALAILDDLGAIVIIAIFYTSDLSLLALGLAALGILGLFILNRSGVRSVLPYILIGIFVWACVLKSGVHATLAGVVTAMFLPYRVDGDREQSALRRVENALHPWVSYGIMPLFAFANAGIDLRELSLESFTHTLTLGIAFGLFFGKQIGVMLAVAGGSALGIFRRPSGASWSQIYGVCILTGIGFTMSLFIGTLAFPDTHNGAEVRLGVLTGSLGSALVGYLILRFLARPLKNL